MKTSIAIPSGLVTNDTTFYAEGRWYDMSGARFYQGSWQIGGGFESITFDKLTGVCRTIHQWTDLESNQNVAFGTHEKLQLLYGNELYDITPAEFVPGNVDGSAGSGYGTGAYGLGAYGTASNAITYPLTWSFSNYGQNLIANPRGQGIFVWENVLTDVAEPLPNSPEVVTYTLAVPQRQIIAFGCTNTSGDFDPLCIRGSDIENPDVWAPATDNNAFEYVLDSGSVIVGARVVANYLMVWTDSAYYLGTFIGAPDEVWRFERQGEHCGLIGPNAAVIDGQVAKWISPDAQFWASGIGSPPQAIPCPISRDFSDNISPGQTDKIVGTTISKFKEVKWFYPDNRDGYENSRAIVFNQDGDWGRDVVSRTAYVDANPSDSPISAAYDGSVYWEERGVSADGAQLSGFMASTDFYVSEAQNLMQINGVWPDFVNQQGTINLELLTRLYPQDANGRTKGPYALTPNQRKKDFRATGRVARIRLSWQSSPASGRMGKLTFDIEQAGGR